MKELVGMMVMMTFWKSSRKMMCQYPFQVA
ncbi:uncharacterized protein METZ01_LOCUS217537 [marine metagenome]|uniref:Uncharacterized protein n=1 Tax=marine metagenome TaxID=408172 RepID=A0A382FR31_9ZZZZ